MDVGSQIAAEGELWIDTPFCWQGRVRGKGADCKGFIAGVAKACGRPEADSIEALCGDYGFKVPVARMRQGLVRLFDRFDPADRRPGDVLLCVMGGQPQHLAIAAPSAINPFRALEAMPRYGVRPATWRDVRVDSAWRWRPIEMAEA